MAVIGLDATSVSVFGKGVSKYQYHLLRSLLKIDRENCYYIFLNNRHVLPDLPAQDNFHYVVNRIPNQVTWDQFQLPFLIRKYRLDTYHSTADVLPLIGKSRIVSYIFEIPDYRTRLLQRRQDCSMYSRFSQAYNISFFKKSLIRTQLIMTSSHSTKIDLVQRYGIDEKKIEVVYPAVDSRFCLANKESDLLKIRNKYNAGSGYILHISSTDPRDNTPVVIHAYKRILHKLPVYKKLIICGNVDPKVEGLDKLITELNLKGDIIFTGYFSAKQVEDFADLYRAADLYIDPSLYEGFGFQVLEAMSCGIPVITSNVTSLPEVVDYAGILIDPGDIDGLAQAMCLVLSDSELRQSMRQKSLERSKVFSWDITARQTLKIYNELSKGCKIII